MILFIYVQKRTEKIIILKGIKKMINLIKEQNILKCEIKKQTYEFSNLLEYIENTYTCKNIINPYKKALKKALRQFDRGFIGKNSMLWDSIENVSEY